jgi:hypothetical protein
MLDAYCGKGLTQKPTQKPTTASPSNVPTAKPTRTPTTAQPTRAPTFSANQLKEKQAERLVAVEKKQARDKKERQNGQVIASVGRKECCFEHGTGVSVVCFNS